MALRFSILKIKRCHLFWHFFKGSLNINTTCTCDHDNVFFFIFVFRNVLSSQEKAMHHCYKIHWGVTNNVNCTYFEFCIFLGLEKMMWNTTTWNWKRESLWKMQLLQDLQVQRPTPTSGLVFALLWLYHIVICGSHCSLCLWCWKCYVLYVEFRVYH